MPFKFSKNFLGLKRLRRRKIYIFELLRSKSEKKISKRFIIHLTLHNSFLAQRMINKRQLYIYTWSVRDNCV
jgi:hypothetical protein